MSEIYAAHWVDRDKLEYERNGRPRKNGKRRLHKSDEWFYIKPAFFGWWVERDIGLTPNYRRWCLTLHGAYRVSKRWQLRTSRKGYDQISQGWFQNDTNR